MSIWNGGGLGLPTTYTQADVAATLGTRRKKQLFPQREYAKPKFVPTGSIAPTPRTVGGEIQGSIAKFLGNFIDENRAARLGAKFMAPLNDATPVGNVVGADEGGRQFYNGLTRGDLGQMGLGALSFGLSVAPVPGGVKRKLKAGMFGNLMRDQSGAIRAYHGGFAHDGNFDLSKAGSGVGYADEPAVWFTPDKYEANRYAWSVGGGPFGERPASGSYFGKAVYPATIDDAGFDDIASMDYDPEEFARIIAEARKANKPGIVFRSVREDDRLSTPADQIAVLDPARIKF